MDRLTTDEGKTFEPVAAARRRRQDDSTPSTTVTARVVGHELGPKILIGKYRKRTGYKRHNGFRCEL